MPYNVKLEQFQGPFDLLLQLIEQEKLAALGGVANLQLSIINHAMHKSQ